MDTLSLSSLSIENIIQEYNIKHNNLGQQFNNKIISGKQLMILGDKLSQDLIIALENNIIKK